MAVKIRLRRVGKKNSPCHRIVVADSRSPRDGRFIENIGVYDPRHKAERIDLERADYWIGQGAKPSETVTAIIRRAKAGVPLGQKARSASEPAADNEAENEAAPETEQPEEPETETGDDDDDQ